MLIHIRVTQWTNYLYLFSFLLRNCSVYHFDFLQVVLVL
jgi:hypothetical protein